MVKFGPGEDPDESVPGLFTAYSGPATFEEIVLPELYGDEPSSFDARLKEVILGYFPGQTPDIIYPGSSGHVGIARAVGAENVLHVDPNPTSIDALRAAGYRAEATTLEDLKLDTAFDMAVFLNSHVTDHSSLLKVLAPGGIVVANNYTRDADFLAQVGQLELAEAYLPNSDEGTWVEGSMAMESLGTVFMARIGDDYQEVTPDYPEAIEAAKFMSGVFVFRRKY